MQQLMKSIPFYGLKNGNFRSNISFIKIQIWISHLLNTLGT